MGNIAFHSANTSNGGRGDDMVGQPVRFDKGVRLTSVSFTCQSNNLGSGSSFRAKVWRVSDKALIATGSGVSTTVAYPSWTQATSTIDATLAAGVDYIIAVERYAGVAGGLCTAYYTQTYPHTHGDGTITATLPSQFQYGAAGAYPQSTTTPATDASYTIAVALSNAAPNAPTLTNPANNATIDRSITQRFAWNFSDPNAGDSQSQFDLQWWPLDSTGTRTAAATTITSATPNTYYDFASGYFAAGDYEWQVRTYDSQGVVGPWSSSSFFTAATAPSPATITAPTSGGTVSSTATLTWSAPNQTDYQWRRVADNAGNADTGTVYADSGDVVSSTTRSVAVTFDTNNRWEHLQVRIKDNGLWSAWSDVRVQVAYTPPATPTYTLTFDTDPTSPTAGTALVSITNPSGTTATASNNVYITDPGETEERRATGVAVNGTWRYWTPPSGFDPPSVGALRVEAVGSNGTTAST